MRPSSADLRERVLRACDAGAGTRAVAARYAVSEAWVRRLKQRRRETGAVGPRAATPGPKPVLGPHADRLRELARQAPDRSAAEYRDRLGVPVDAVTVWRALRRLGRTHKKSPSGRPSRTGRTWPPGGRRGGLR